VLLIEKRQEIGSPVRCGEGVDIRLVSKYIPPDKRWIASEITGVLFTAPDGTTVELTVDMMVGAAGGAPTVVLERKIFDRDLAKNAARAGAHVMVRTRATGLITEDGAVTGVKMNRLGEDFEVRSKVVIGADGVESQVGRWAGLNTTLKLRDIESCAQYHMDNVDVLEKALDFYLGDRFSPSGYAWIFPKGERSANVGLGVLGSKIADKRPIEYLNEFVADKFPQGQPVGLVMGGVPVSEGLRDLTSDGLMLIGDSARHTEPLSGGGIIPALETGITAGRVACKAVNQNDASTQVLREYETEFYNSPYGKQRKRMYKAKEFVVHRSDEDFNRMIRVMQGVTPQEMTMRGIITRLLKKDPTLLFMIRHLL
jgi:digeranylgeranylglycerophospholipid reductase